MRNIAIIFLAAFAMVGCSNIKSETFTSANKDQVLSDIQKSQLSDDEKKSIAAALVRSALGSYSLEGKTISQVIEDQKAWQADQDVQAAAAHEQQLKIESEHAAMVAAMTHAISVQPLSKRYTDADPENEVYDAYEYVTFQFHNTGTKTVVGFKGDVDLTNSFGDKVIGLAIEEGGSGSDGMNLRPGAMATDELRWKVNPFEDEWKALESTELSSMKAVWVPDQILFADGSTLKAPSQDS